jgi:lysozyme
MFKKTVEGVRKFLENVFGKKQTLEEKLKIGIEQAGRGEVVERKEFKDKIAELPEERQEAIQKKTEELKERYSDTLQALGGDGLMHMSKEGLADIVQSESITTTKYRDSAGVWTIGVGATKSEIRDLRTWPADKKLSLEEVFELLHKGIKKYSKGVREALEVEVSQHMFDGLVSFAYNVGVGGMKGSSLIRAINRGVTDKKTLKAYLMRWNKITVRGQKVVSRGLVNRRKKEAHVMFDANYLNKKMIGRVIPVNSKSKPMYRSKRAYTIDLNKYL